MRQTQQRPTPTTATAPDAPRRRRPPWQTAALPVLGVWLLAAPHVLHGTLDTTGMVSATLSGVLLLVTGIWARLARNPAPAYALALAAGVWLLIAPTIWEFGDGTSSMGLVPLVGDLEPTRAAIARMRWDSIGAGLLVISLVGSVLLPRNRRPHIWAT
jgi:SPW repeat